MLRDLIFIALALFTWGLGEGMFFIFQPLYLQQLGADPVRVGGILGAAGAAMFIVHLPAGYLADRFGRRPLLRAAWLMGAASTLLMALATSLQVFAFALIAYGVTAFVISPLNSYITAARGRLSVARVITLIAISYNLGAIAGPFAGGLIAGSTGLRSVYMVSAAIFGLSTVFIFFVRPQPIDPTEHGQLSFQKILNRRFSLYLGIVFLAFFATYFSQPLSPMYLQNHHALEFEQIGQLGSVSSLGVVALNLVLGQIDSRLGFLLAQGASGLFALTLWQGSGMPILAVGYFLLGGFRTTRSLAIAQARELIPASQMGLGYGLVESLGGLTVLLAPPLAGIFYSHNPAYMYMFGLGITGLSLLASGLFLYVRRASSPEAARM
jgi:MFS family permease